MHQKQRSYSLTYFMRYFGLKQSLHWRVLQKYLEYLQFFVEQKGGWNVMKTMPL